MFKDKSGKSLFYPDKSVVYLLFYPDKSVVYLLFYPDKNVFRTTGVEYVGG